MRTIKLSDITIGDHVKVTALINDGITSLFELPVGTSYEGNITKIEYDKFLFLDGEHTHCEIATGDYQVFKLVNIQHIIEGDASLELNGEEVSIEPLPESPIDTIKVGDHIKATVIKAPTEEDSACYNLPIGTVIEGNVVVILHENIFFLDGEHETHLEAEGDYTKHKVINSIHMISGDVSVEINGVPYEN